MTLPGPGPWTAAGLVALALHLGVLAAVLSAPPDGAEAPGLGGVSVALTLTAARAGAEADARDQAAEPPQEAPPADIVPPYAVTAAPADAAPVPPQPIQAFEPPPVAAEAAVAITPADPLPLPERRPPPPVKTPPVKPSPPAPAKPIPAKPAPSAVPAPQAREASRAATASQGKRDDGRKGQSADTRDAQGGGPVGTPAPNYVNLLRYWLERNKTYPKDARRLRQQGVVNLYFRVTRDGRVLRHEIRKSSGHALLDGEAEAMLQRAQPLPKFTDDMKGGYLDVVVPVLFSLRGNS
ncbi:MAG: energy transducer TonB [Rhodospirillales bacterium]